MPPLCDNSKSLPRTRCILCRRQCPSSRHSIGQANPYQQDSPAHSIFSCHDVKVRSQGDATLSLACLSGQLNGLHSYGLHDSFDNPRDRARCCHITIDHMSGMAIGWLYNTTMASRSARTWFPLNCIGIRYFAKQTIQLHPSVSFKLFPLVKAKPHQNENHITSPRAGSATRGAPQ